MNEHEIDRLQILLRDDFLFATVEKLFRTTVEESKPSIGGEDNEVLGQKYRSYEEASEILRKCFRKLKELKVGERAVDKVDRAR